jgi:hypothetical protein
MLVSILYSNDRCRLCGEPILTPVTLLEHVHSTSAAMQATPEERLIVG